MSDSRENFIELMGRIHQHDGQSRIHGRLFGLLLMEKKGLSLQQMADRLQVSKASVSTNARHLKEKGLIRLTSSPGDRQDYYELVSSPYDQMYDLIRKDMLDMAGQIAEAREQLEGEDSVIIERVERLEEFYRISAEVLGDIANKLRK
ncbi:GbsR/MarR family transcriptional regulator [Reinekea blandensis]|nr:MarR family transcriptional regulator [Reinekea blandensis]